MQVESFLASLALGTTRRDADLEDAIADKLHGVYHDCATLQHRLNQWSVSKQPMLYHWHLESPASVKFANTSRPCSVKLITAEESPACWCW